MTDQDKHFGSTGVEHQKHKEFLALLMKYQTPLYTYILLMVTHEHDAEDIFQETTALMWTKFDEFERGTSFVAWGCQIARYLVYNFRRRKANQKVYFSSPIVEMISQYAESKLNDDDQRTSALKKCLGRLNQNDRMLVYMHYEKGFTIKKAAEKTGRSIHTLYKTMARIHENLLRCMRTSLRMQDG